jgi:hypothetical protein
VQKLSNGQVCAVPTDCATGNCVPVSGTTSVCCTSACNVPGGTCAGSAATTGQCTCPACAGGGTCAIFYPDNDNDGYGDRNATLPATMATPPTATNAVVACAGTPPVHGTSYPAAYYVTDHTDCNDADNRAHPGATFQTSAATGGGFDFDCDGNITPQFPVYKGASCHACSSAPSCGNSTCGASGAETIGSLSCAIEYGNCCSCFVIIDPPIQTLSLVKNITENPDISIPVRCCACSAQSCGPNDRAGFVAAVNCGQTAEFDSCGSCSGTTLGATTYTYPAQGCK